MENPDPAGIHAGDGIIVAPAQTLTDNEAEMLRVLVRLSWSILGIEGNLRRALCHCVQMAEYAVLEADPCISRIRPLIF